MGAKDQISYYFLKIDYENEKILNVLAEQNMLSQRITKLSLLIQNDLEFDTLANSRPDSLGRLLPRWKSNHVWLLEHNVKHGASDFTAEQTDSLLRLANPLLEQIYRAGIELLQSRKNADSVSLKVKIIDRHELPYHKVTEQSIRLYRLESAERAKQLQIKDKSQVFNTARIEALELQNLLEVAKATMIAAEARQEPGQGPARVQGRPVGRREGR